MITNDDHQNNLFDQVTQCRQSYLDHKLVVLSLAGEVNHPPFNYDVFVVIIMIIIIIILFLSSMLPPTFLLSS